MASPDELLAMLEEAAGEAEHGITQEQLEEDEEEDSYQEVLDDWMEELLDEISLGLCFEVHRSCKIGIFLLDDTDKESEKKYEKAVDVFGQVPMKKQLECVCPNCQRNLAASRFAPHLEKCMGMGRNSSRIASRRIANSGKKEESENESEENNEDDWTYMADRKGSGSRAKKIKRDRRHDSPRRNKSSKKTSAGDNGGDHSFTPAYEALTVEDRKALLLQTCGVISEHTKKMCTRSHRCPQHSDDQRRAVRVYLLGGGVDNDDIHVDIDSYEDGDTQALRDSLQWEATSNPSPADSTSTTNSTSSRKKKSSRSSKKKSGNNKTPSAGTPSSLYDFV